MCIGHPTIGEGISGKKLCRSADKKTLCVNSSMEISILRLFTTAPYSPYFISPFIFETYVSTSYCCRCNSKTAFHMITSNLTSKKIITYPIGKLVFSHDFPTFSFLLLLYRMQPMRNFLLRNADLLSCAPPLKNPKLSSTGLS